MLRSPAPAASAKARPSPVEEHTFEEGIDSVTRLSYCMASSALRE